MRRYETTHLFHTSYGIFLSSLSAFVEIGSSISVHAIDYSTSRGSLVVKKFWIFVDLISKKKGPRLSIVLVEGNHENDTFALSTKTHFHHQQ